jgi:hypothetical protein
MDGSGSPSASSANGVMCTANGTCVWTKSKDGGSINNLRFRSQQKRDDFQNLSDKMVISDYGCESDRFSFSCPFCDNFKPSSYF